VNNNGQFKRCENRISYYTENFDMDLRISNTLKLGLNIKNAIKHTV